MLDHPSLSAAGVGRVPRADRPRVACVLDAHNRGSPTACGYIRMILPLTRPKVIERLDIRFAQPDQVAALRPDAVVVQRFGASGPEQARALIADCKRNGVPVVYEIDDDLTAVGPDHGEYLHYRNAKAHVLEFVKSADQVWASTAILAERLRAHAADVRVIQNELDERIWKPRPVPDAREEVDLVYMGSTTHSRDFWMILKPAFDRLQRELGSRVRLSLIGVMEGAIASPGVRAIPVPGDIGACYPSFARWLQHLPQFDVGVAPLTSTPFNEAKSHIKWLEYAGMGAITVASAVGEYRTSIQPGRTGVLAADGADGFFEALREIVLNQEARRDLSQHVVRMATLHNASLAGHSVRLEALLNLVADRAAYRDGRRESSSGVAPGIG